MKFYFFLASELGYTVRDLLESLDSEELMYWIAYFNIKVKEEEKNQKEMERKSKAKRRR